MGRLLTVLVIAGLTLSVEAGAAATPPEFEALHLVPTDPQAGARTAIETLFDLPGDVRLDGFRLEVDLPAGYSVDTDARCLIDGRQRVPLRVEGPRLSCELTGVTNAGGLSRVVLDGLKNPGAAGMTSPFRVRVLDPMAQIVAERDGESEDVRPGDIAELKPMPMIGGSGSLDSWTFGFSASNPLEAFDLIRLVFPPDHQPQPQSACRVVQGGRDVIRETKVGEHGEVRCTLGAPLDPSLPVEVTVTQVQNPTSHVGESLSTLRLETLKPDGRLIDRLGGTGGVTVADPTVETTDPAPCATANLVMVFGFDTPWTAAESLGIHMPPGFGFDAGGPTKARFIHGVPGGLHVARDGPSLLLRRDEGPTVPAGSQMALELTNLRNPCEATEDALAVLIKGVDPETPSSKPKEEQVVDTDPKNRFSSGTTDPKGRPAPGPDTIVVDDEDPIVATPPPQSGRSGRPLGLTGNALVPLVSAVVLVLALAGAGTAYWVRRRRLKK